MPSRCAELSRKAEPFSAVFLPEGAGEFTVCPASGTLPPAGSAGLLLTVSFTPTTHGQKRAKLLIQVPLNTSLFPLEKREVKSFGACKTPTVPTISQVVVLHLYFEALCQHLVAQTSPLHELASELQ